MIRCRALREDAPLPRIETFFLAGPSGRIECLLKRPVFRAADDAHAGAAVVCHPHPLFGGTLHNRVVHAAAEAIGREGIPVLRFNFRGAGGSGGRHDGGRGEQDDLKVVLEHLSGRFPRLPLLIAGYSFGAFVGLRVGCADDRVTALIGIGLPVGLYDFRFLEFCGKPLSLVQGDQDPFGPLASLMTIAARLPGGCRVLAIGGAGHGFTGHLDELRERVSASIPEAMKNPAGPGPAG